MTPDWLKRAGEALYGSRYQAPLARALGRSRNCVGRWAAGRYPMPAEDADKIVALMADRHLELERLIYR